MNKGNVQRHGKCLANAMANVRPTPIKCHETTAMALARSVTLDPIRCSAMSKYIITGAKGGSPPQGSRCISRPRNIIAGLFEKKPTTLRD